MKKVSKMLLQIGLVAVVAVLLTACGKKQSATYSISESGLEMEITLNAKGDKVYEQVLKTSIPYSLVGVENKDDAKEMFDEELSDYKELKGVKREVDYSDDKVSQTFTLDLKKIDFDEVEEELGAEYDSDAKKHGVSFKATTENLEDEGWTKK